MPVANRNISIDILKFFAVFLITNSHLESMYTHYSGLATGGAFGDALFFFCSGFTLFLGRFGRFDNWYKRRIGRIYPSLFGWVIVDSFFFANTLSMKDIVLGGGRWFISVIMVYYVLLYFIRRFMFNRLWLAVCLNVVVLLVWYVFFFEDKETEHILGDAKPMIYFIFVLQGAILGLRGKPKCRPIFDGAMFLVCFVAYFVFRALCKSSPTLSWFQFLVLIPLLGFTYYLYKLANTNAMERFYNNKVCHWVIMAVSGLCLEVYLCQGAVITNKLNYIFPLNLIVVFLGILILAYVVRCIGHWFAQSFRKEDYDWRGIVRFT